MKKDKAFFIPVFFLYVFLCLPNASVNGYEGYKEITAPEVKEYLKSGDVLLVNVLSSIEFEMQHIEGSVNIPINEIITTDKLPKDKGKILIFHCMGQK